MKRVIIICEGKTEKVFCENVLLPYLIDYDIFIQAPLIKSSRGGIVGWGILKKQIIANLYESDVIVTTFIDYYGLCEQHNFPNWAEANKITNKNERMDFLENAMKEDIADTISHKYIPYLQLHEFEGLLFNDIRFFYDYVQTSELIGIAELEKTFEDYTNPEMINDDKDSSPSHRLARIIKDYDKVLYGHYFAEAIGIERIRAKAPRFDQWIDKLIEA